MGWDCTVTFVLCTVVLMEVGVQWACRTPLDPVLVAGYAVYTALCSGFYQWCSQTRACPHFPGTPLGKWGRTPHHFRFNLHVQRLLISSRSGNHELDVAANNSHSLTWPPHCLVVGMCS